MIRPSDAAALPLEIIGYLLGSPTHLSSGNDDVPDMGKFEDWLQTNTVSWQPGLIDLKQSAIEAQSLAAKSTGRWHFVSSILDRACHEYEANLANRVTRARAEFSARRRLPRSTLLAFGSTSLSAATRSDAVDNVVVDGCSDPHVHQGASLGFHQILIGAMLSISDLGEYNDYENAQLSVTVDGLELSVTPMIAGMSILLRTDGDGCSGLGETVSRASRGDLEAWSSLQSTLTDVFETVPDVDCDLYDPVAFKRSINGYWKRDSLVLLLSIETILYRGFGQSGPGLENFIAAFGRLSRVRKMSSAPRSVSLEHAIAEMRRSTPTLQHVDYRVGEALFVRGAASSMLQTTVEFAEAYRDYLKNANSISLTLPLGIIKSIPVATEIWRYDVGDLWLGVGSFFDALEVDESLWSIFHGFDVCGDELAMPTWVIGPTLSAASRRLSARGLSVDLRVHAGEEFYSPLNGMRSMAIACSIDRSGFSNLRIGHGLALESEDYSRLPEQPVSELLDDLVFAYGLGSNSIGLDLIRRLERAILELLEPVYGRRSDWVRGRDLNVLVAADELRMDVRSLERMSLLSTTGDWFEFVDERPYLSDQTAHAVASWSWLGRNESCWLESGINVIEIRELISDLRVPVAAAVRDMLINAGAVIEVCPSSNANIGRFRGFTHHPVSLFVQSGLDVVVGSDDPAVFHSGLRDEYDLLFASQLLTEQELTYSCRRATALVPDGCKGDAAREVLDRFLMAVEWT